MESIELAPDWKVQLQTPNCDLRFDGCTSQSTHGLRIHTCKFHYACPGCLQKFLLRVEESYDEFTKMRCKDCHRGFSRGRFYNLVKL